MIPNQWYAVLESREVRVKPVGVTRMGEQLVFWRDGDGRLRCLRDRCVHRGVRLSDGKVKDGRLQCPFHGFEYDGSGRIAVIPANGRRAPVPAGFAAPGYPVHEDHGLAWIWWGASPPDTLGPPPFFEDIGDDLAWASAHDPWSVHYSRAIENQLDVVHLPFVHYNTIGRGNRTLVDGPGVRWIDENRFHVYVSNRVDDGSTPLKPSEFPLEPEPAFKLEFIFPNLWQNYISPTTRIVAAFVPVDHHHTVLYLRYYQGVVRIPVLRDIVARLSMPLNLYIAHQDRRVVQTHEPSASGLRIGEKLIRGDHPIIEYRRRRAELKALAGVPEEPGASERAPEETS